MPDDRPNETELHPHLVLDFPGDRGQFRSHQHMNLALLWKHKTAIQNGEYEAVMLFAETMVLDDERERLFDFLISHGNDEGFLNVVYDAIWNCHLGRSNLPLAPSSDFSISTSETDSSSTDDSSSPDTEADPEES